MERTSDHDIMIDDTASYSEFISSSTLKYYTGKYKLFMWKFNIYL